MDVRFGPAGSCDDYQAEGHKSLAALPAFLAQRGLHAFEYQCGHGVRLSEKSALPLRAGAEEYGIAMSLHAPYFISLASAEPDKRENSIRYILQSARAVDLLGGVRIVVHPGGLGGLSRADATSLACETLTKAQRALDEEGLSHIRICPETMGKINQLGDLEEILQLCTVDERFLPCIDFGHLNARSHGDVASEEAFAAILDRISNRLGTERGAHFHSHFSKIEYSDGGEKRHLTFEDTVFGPDPIPLLRLVAKRNLSVTFICESRGTQTRDAAQMQEMYQNAMKEGGLV